MTKRDRLITLVASYVYESGRCDIRCTRVYVENRMSREAWNEGIRRGLVAHAKKPAA
jgi:hypothetical protein